MSDCFVCLQEKYSHQQFNLACIVTLPCYQKHGYGRFLIDFSYLLSRRENLLGTPERPLSDMGRVAYESYWRGALLEFLWRRREAAAGVPTSLSAAEIARATGITPQDVVDAARSLDFIAPAAAADELAASTAAASRALIGGTLCWSIDWEAVRAHWMAAQASRRRVWLDESRLRWTPRVYTPHVDVRSPLRSPIISNSGGGGGGASQSLATPLKTQVSERIQFQICNLFFTAIEWRK